MDKQQNNKNKPIRILSKPLAFSADGHIISIRTDQTGEILFFQVANPEIEGSETIDALGVAAIRMSVEQFMALRNAIDGTIKAHEEKMTKKSTSSKK